MIVRRLSHLVFIPVLLYEYSNGCGKHHCPSNHSLNLLYIFGICCFYFDCIGMGSYSGVLDAHFLGTPAESLEESDVDFILSAHPNSLIHTYNCLLSLKVGMI